MIEAIPRPSVSSIRSRLRLRLTPDQQRFLLRAVVLAFAVRIAILAAGYITGYAIIGRDGVAAPDIIRETFLRWDAPHFQFIAEHGYQNFGDERNFLVFLPLYPWVVMVVQFIIPSFLVAALLVSAVSSVAAGYFIQSLVHRDGGDDSEANRSLLYFFLFPTAYFLAMPYTEALFMALVLGSFVAARRGSWWWAGLLGGLACMTRIQGVIIGPALLVEAFHQERFRRIPWKALWLALVPAGFSVFLLVNWIVSGDPLEFMDLQREHWSQRAVWPWWTLRDTWNWITQEAPGGTRVTIYEFRAVFLLVSAGFLLAGWRWLRPSYQVFAWGAILFFLASSWQISIPRYTLMLFPVFLSMARIGRDPIAHQAMLTVSALLMGVFYIVYAKAFGF